MLRLDSKDNVRHTLYAEVLFRTFFYDGNKRIALTLGTYFLHKNNYYWHACTCMRALESFIYHVAASNIDQDLLLRIVDCFMSGKDYDEELKIDIANAMSKGKLGI